MRKESVEIEQWDRYWAYGNIHSFSQVAGGNYGGAVLEFWRSRFESLADGARILDIGTGNGAIALIALEVSDRLSRGFEICATDLADIDPAAHVGDERLADQLKFIDFHGRTPAESLPFDDASFDAVASQFGIEYSNLPDSLAEAARVLRSGGVLALITHHRDSVLLGATRLELEQLDLVLDDAKLYLRARNFLRAMEDGRRGGKSRGAGPASKKMKKRRALEEAIQRIQQAARAAPNANMLLGPLRYVQEILSVADRKTPAELMKWLEEAHRRVLANQRRLLDMTAAALREEDVREVAGRLSSLSFGEVEAAPFFDHDGALLGWRLEAVKRG